jgi:hypothetical protein
MQSFLHQEFDCFELNYCLNDMCFLKTLCKFTTNFRKAIQNM